MSTNSTTEFFLINKKVKISKDTNLKEIVRLLKEDGIHTAYIENKEEVHSLFFTEYDTMFLLPGTKADAEFDASSLKEISEEAFLNLMGYKVKIETIDEYAECRKLPEHKKPKNKFITVLDKTGVEFNIRKKNVDIFYYKESKIHFYFKNKEQHFFTIDEEQFNKIKYIMQN